MSSIRIHLDAAEYDVVSRYAQLLGVKTEDVAYAALNRLMLASENQEVHRDIVETREWRRNSLPMWSDSAGSVHAYEAMPDEDPVRKQFT